jgi:hypothetical protein
MPFANDPGGVSVDFTFADPITTAAGQPGIHKAVFTDGNGVTWTVWRPDQGDNGPQQVTMNLPKSGAGNTLPLASGSWAIRVSSFSWPGFDPENFMWSDVEREYARFAHSVPVNATPP